MPASIAGVNEVLDTVFHGGSQTATWYVGLINNSGFTGIAAADTPSSHAGWTEATGYSGDRPAWVESAATNGSIVATTPSVFSFTSTQVIRGFFIISVATKGGTTGTLKTSNRWLFSSPRTFHSGNQLGVNLAVLGAM